MTPQDFETLTGQNVVTVLAEIIGLEGRPTLTPEETFKWLGLGRTAGYEALRREEIPSVRVGGRILCPVPALLLWLLDVAPRDAEASAAVTDASAAQLTSAVASRGSSLAPS